MAYLWTTLLSCVIGASALSATDVSAREAERDPHGSEIRRASKTDPITTGPAPLAKLQRPAFLDEVAMWLSSEFQLPRVSRRPVVAFVPARRLASLRHRNSPSYFSNVDWVSPQGNPDILSVYLDDAETVLLHDGWSGATPGELSVLVHEMVHHVQNAAGLRFACPEEREKMAFAAQEKWLALHGSDLLTEFQLDPLTLLVRTNCLH